MEGVLPSHQEYRSYVARLGSVLKPGGKVLYYGSENKLGYYVIDSCSFPSLITTAEFTLSAFKDAGFHDLEIEKFTCDEYPNRVFRFIKRTWN